MWQWETPPTCAFHREAINRWRIFHEMFGYRRAWIQKKCIKTTTMEKEHRWTIFGNMHPTSTNGFILHMNLTVCVGELLHHVWPLHYFVEHGLSKKKMTQHQTDSLNKLHVFARTTGRDNTTSTRVGDNRIFSNAASTNHGMIAGSNASLCFQLCMLDFPTKHLSFPRKKP